MDPEGWLYLAVVIDLFPRRVVGWKYEFTHEGEHTVTDARSVWRFGSVGLSRG